MKLTDMRRWINLPGQMFFLLGYFFSARHRKGHGIRSPFVFNFITSVLADKIKYNAYDITEQYKKSLLKNRSLITLTDFGAGSHAGSPQTSSVADVARHAAVNRKFGRLLCRIARYYNPDRIIELGTSLGISTHYLALGNAGTTVMTVEADPALADLAVEGFKNDRIMNVSVVNDTFDNALSALSPVLPGKTLIFIDGNHCRSATLKYTDFFLSKITDGSIIVLDDINWSSGMRQAWKEIRKNRKCTLTVDLFRMGIVFIAHDNFKENYRIRF